MNEYVKTFTQAELEDFSRLSGDRNPVHLVQECGRLSPWGKVVVHGVAQLLWCLEQWAATRSSGIVLQTLAASFSKGLGVGEEVRLNFDDDGREVRLALRDALGDNVLNLRFCYLEGKTLPGGELPSRTPDHHEVRKRDISETAAVGSIERLSLCCDATAMAHSHPVLAAAVDRNQLAVILSTTRFVGNVWPGLNSIFQGLQLAFSQDSQPDNYVDYTVVSINPKLSLTKIAVSNSVTSGTVNAFFRPPVIELASAMTLRGAVREDEFAGQVALVIGGSRGVGEVVSKILALGGATVSSTYYKCRQSAARIESELRSLGVKIDFSQLDVENMSRGQLEHIAAQGYTHVYYFPTPFIFQGSRGRFSAPLFAAFSSVYLEAFMRIFEATRHCAKVYLNPSSVAVEEHSPLMLEYSMAKYSMELMAATLMQLYAGIKIHTPRLRRMRTDQTNSLIRAQEVEVEAEMLDLLRNM
jgi:NAD(P)-dependent dehydrogenase (short-subunit alcohol dehydrogenase family)